jgi:hypothetical protein
VITPVIVDVKTRLLVSEAMFAAEIDPLDSISADGGAPNALAQRVVFPIET